MDSSNEKMELEEGEINDLEDGEIADDEIAEETLNTVSNTSSLNESTNSDLSKRASYHHVNKTTIYNSKFPQGQIRKDNGPPPRYKNNWTRERENPTRPHLRPAFFLPEFNGPKPTNLPRKPRGRHRPLPQLIPRLIPPLIQPLPRAKPLFSHEALEETPPSDNTSDFDLLLERHKQIQLQLEDLEREESAMTNDDIIDDSFVDIPVDDGSSNDKNKTDDQELVADETSGILTKLSPEEKSQPKNFSPFKIKTLRPPIPTIKELSERQKQKEEVQNELESSTPIMELSPKTTTSPKTSVLSKRKRRRGRRRKQRDNLSKASNVKSKANETRDILTESVIHDKPNSEIESRLMELASSSGLVDIGIKLRNSNAEQQKKRREKLRQWQQSHSDSLVSKGSKSPGVRRISESKDFEKDDYLEAPMDVESDTPDGPVLPLIEDTGDDPPPPPPPPPGARDVQELILIQQQQQMPYRNYPAHTLANQVHVSPNIHGFYPPGQIVYGEWASVYPVTSSPADQESINEQPSRGKEEQKVVGSEEEDDDEADLLREILLKSVAKKRAAKSSEKKTLNSAPVSPQPTTSSTQTSRPTTPKNEKKGVSVLQDKKINPPQSLNRVVPLHPPQHDPVVIQLGQDSDEDSDSSDKEEHLPELTQRGGFIGSLDMMIKQARNSAVENTKPKAQASKGEPNTVLQVPKTPDALAHLPEERRAEYKRLKEQLALHEGRKRQPLSDISQDKETKSDSDVGEEKLEAREESSEVLEVKQKVKTYEEKLAKTRKSLSEDQSRLAKMTSILTEKTTLLEEQELRVAKIKKQLEAHQKAMLNNRLAIKNLHEKAILVKERVTKRQAHSRNTEEELLRMKSLMSAMRKNPGLYTSNENKEISKEETHPHTKTQELKSNESQNKAIGASKRSMVDPAMVALKRAKLEPPKSQSLKASPRKQALAEMIAQEKARLKALEQELAQKLSQYSKSSTSTQETTSNIQSDPSNKKTGVLGRSTKTPRHESKSEERVMESSKEDRKTTGFSKGKEGQVVEYEPVKIDGKQLEYVKTLQAEKEKKGAVFPSVTSELPLPIHKSVAKCIWLEAKPEDTPVTDIQPANLDWLSSTNRPDEVREREVEREMNGDVTVRLYKSILLHFKSYRLSPYFRTKAGLSLKSLSHTNKLNPSVPLCKYDLKGTCNDEGCRYQHKRDYIPTDEDTIRDLAAYSLSDKDPSTPDAADKKVQMLVNNFTAQYKGKISMDELYLLLVNHVKQESKMFLPYYIRGFNHSLLLHKQADIAVVEDTEVFDSGKGVQFVAKEKQKRSKYARATEQECQEVRYFSEVYNSLNTLSEAIEESPSNVTLWIKLARLQLCQDKDNVDETQDSEMGIVQSLNTLSRGLEANPTSEDLWLEYLKLFNTQGSPEEHRELCEQALGFTPSYDIWWHYLESIDNYYDKRKVCIRLINHLAEQETRAGLHSHHILEALLYLIQLELYTGRFKLALSTFMVAIAKKTSTDNEIPKLSTRLLPEDLSLVWLAYIYVFEFHGLPTLWFDQKCSQPSRMVAKDHFVFPWQPSGGTKAASDKLLALFHEALRSCTYKDKTTSKVTLCLPLYQNLLALERAHGRVDSAKGICRRLLQSSPTLIELWECLQALENSTGNPSQALAVLDEGLQKCSNDCELAYTMACVHLEQGHAAEAVEVLINNVKSKYLKTPPCDTSQGLSGNTEVDPIMLYRKVLHQPLPYDSQQLSLRDDAKPTGKDELNLWLSYCLVIQLAPNISPLCLQYNLTAESAYETAVHSIVNIKNAQTVWLEYLFYMKSKLPKTLDQSSLQAFDDLINRCLVSVSTSRSLPFSTSESWQDYSFHNQVIRLYLECLPQSLWSAIYTKYLKAYPDNLQLALRACEHEVNVGCVDQAVKIATMFLAVNPLCITMWKIIISLNLQRKHLKEARKLYQQSTEVLPFAATLWKDYIMFEMVHSDGKSSIDEVTKVCNKVGVDVQEYLHTLLSK